VGIQRKRVNWVLDADIRGFFDNMGHEWTMNFIEHRVADRRILRLIRKWLKAGVSEDGQWLETKVGNDALFCRRLHSAKDPRDDGGAVLRSYRRS